MSTTETLVWVIVGGGCGMAGQVIAYLLWAWRQPSIVRGDGPRPELFACYAGDLYRQDSD